MPRPKKVISREISTHVIKEEPKAISVWIDESSEFPLDKELMEKVLAPTPTKEEKVIPANVGRVTLYCQ